MRMFHAFGSLDSFSTRTSPWSCPDFNGADSSQRTFDLLATTDSMGNIVTRGLHPSPVWANDILDILHQEGRPESDDDEPVVYITSYFLDHVGHPHHAQPRLLRFDSDVTEWERDVCLIWEDHIDVSVPFDVTIVRPDSPYRIYPDAVATAIVHQRATFANAAALVTTVHIADPTTWFSEFARSFPRQVGIEDIFQAAQVYELCQERLMSGYGACTLHSGHHQLPDGQIHPLHHGIGLHIRVPPALGAEELEQNFVRRVRQRQLQHPSHQWSSPSQDEHPEDQHPRPTGGNDNPEDAISFMARQLTIQDSRATASSAHSGRSSRSSSRSSSSTSSISLSSEPEDWRQTVIFSLDGRSISMQLPWHDQTEMYRLAANEFGIDSLDIIRLHLVLHRPLDYIQVDLHGLLLQRNHEFRPTPFERLILLDLELHVDNDVQPSPFRRYVRWVPCVTDRTAFFHFLGLERVLEDHRDISYMWRNNIVVPRRDAAPMNLHDGDYVKIFVGDVDMQEQCISESDAAIQDEAATSNDSGDASSLFQRSISQFQQVIHDFGQQVKTIEAKTDPNHQDPTGPITERPARLLPLPRTPFQRGFHPEDHRRLQRLFDENSFIECEEEGRVAYIETWHIHHQQQRHCRTSRSMKLFDNPDQWIEEILALWDLDEAQENDIIVHVVQPTPPCTRFQCVLAHIIVEQAPQPDLNVGIISIEASDAGGTSIEHEAHSLPDWMGRNMVLRKAELEVFCQTRICTVSLGALPFGLVDIEEVPRAVCLTIHIRPVLLYNHENDFTDLMQRPGTRWHKPPSPQDGQDLSSSPARCDGTAFVFNPNAPAFNPAVPTIGNLPENVQDLYQAWLRNAFSWEGESASGNVITWFVDQHNLALHHCQAPRVVRLYDNVQQWETQLRQVWRDIALPGAPILLHVVDPHPSNLDEAHVLIIQNSLDQFSTSLVTGYDSAVNQPGPVFQLAMTTPEILHYDQLLMSLGLGGRCLFPGSPAICALHYGNYEIRQGVPFPARDGHGLTIRITPRPTFQNQAQQNEAPVLLQLSTLVQPPRASERLTTVSVAHGQWPLPEEPNEMSDPLQPIDQNMDQTIGIRLISGCSTLMLPEYIECHSPGTSEDITEELSHWGFDCQAIRLGQHWTAFCLPRSWCPESQEVHYMFVHQEVKDDKGIIPHTADHLMTDLEIMQLLYQLGYQRAVILSNEDKLPQFHIVEFLDVVQNSQDKIVSPKTPPNWPARLSEDRHNIPFFSTGAARPDPDFLIHTGIQEDDMIDFFASGNDILCRDPLGHDLPDSTKAVMQISPHQDLAKFDRIVIYADGSSQPTHRHKPAQWNDEQGFGDTWAFAAVGETYVGSQTRIEVIGWLAQPVRYEDDSASFLGSCHIGSLPAEREAMTWAALWRLSQNVNTPTLFRTDSSITASQSTGAIGTQTLDLSFQILRGCFQALETALGDRLEVEHIPGHCNEPYNDLVDYLAQQERVKSFYFPRQRLDMRQWRRFIPYLWMVFSTADGLPPWSSSGFSVPPPQLPPQDRPSQDAGTTCEPVSSAQIHISICSANVGSMYNGEWGHAGKLDYLRAQFIALGLNFLGIQEARTAELCSKSNDIYRLAGGSDNGNGGIELWINLSQAYAHVGARPLLFAPHHFIVVTMLRK